MHSKSSLFIFLVLERVFRTDRNTYKIQSLRNIAVWLNQIRCKNLLFCKQETNFCLLIHYHYANLWQCAFETKFYGNWKLNCQIYVALPFSTSSPPEFKYRLFICPELSTRSWSAYMSNRNGFQSIWNSWKLRWNFFEEKIIALGFGHFVRTNQRCRHCAKQRKIEQHRGVTLAWYPF